MAPATHAHESLFWRRLAHWGASRGPEWWVRYSPPLFGWAAAALVPDARRAVLRNIHRVRGPGSKLADARAVLRTFSTYASCLAEVLSNDAPGGPRAPHTSHRGEHHLDAARALGKGIVMVTAHTAGWEALGPVASRGQALPIVLVMHAEGDVRARVLHDGARTRAGVSIQHVGDDPLSSLPLLRHLRRGGIVALQLDRTVPGMRARRVTMFGEDAAIPEGPLRLAQLTGAAILPMFSARVGYRSYVASFYPPRTVSREAKEQELDEIAQSLAGTLGGFLREHPTQWFHFGS